MLVITKSLSGFVANQLQYNMESAQYLRYSYYIMIIIKHILDLYVHIYIYIYIHIYIIVPLLKIIYIYIYISVSVCLCVCIYIYIYIYIYINLYYEITLYVPNEDELTI